MQNANPDNFPMKGRSFKLFSDLAQSSLHPQLAPGREGDQEGSDRPFAALVTKVGSGP